jgi:outer membrane protein OmpA-like peptidoglycan-associated protein
MLRARDRASPKGLAALLFVSLAFPFAARAVDLDLKLEPGAAVSLSSPQSDRFQFGGAATLKGLAGLEGGYVNLTASLTFLGLPAETGFGSTSTGTAWAPGVGLRIQLPRESELMRAQRPHRRESFYGAKPWIDGDFLYVRTGGLDRVGFATAVGLSFPMGESRSFQLGPFVRYFQIIQGNRAGFDNRDANTIIFGLSLETGTRLVRPQPIDAMAPVAMAVAVPAERRDRDGDGVVDEADDCPDIRGLASNRGCPVYEKIIITPEKLEMKEKIQFAWNDSAIEPASYAALGEAARALQDNPAFRVAIEGHASSEGADDHNQSLSSRRADAVLEYIASHGVARDRLVAKGFSSSRPIESNSSESGRVANRRVEFVVHFIILKEGGLQ